MFMTIYLYCIFKAGPEVKSECSRILSQRVNPSVSDVRITSAGSLFYHYFIHTIFPDVAEKKGRQFHNTSFKPYYYVFCKYHNHSQYSK